MALQSPPSPRKDWNYDRYFLSHLNKNKKKDESQTNTPLKTN